MALILHKLDWTCKRFISRHEDVIKVYVSLHHVKEDNTDNFFLSPNLLFPRREQRNELGLRLLCTKIIKLHIPKREVTQNGCKRGWY